MHFVVVRVESKTLKGYRGIATDTDNDKEPSRCVEWASVGSIDSQNWSPA